MLSIWMPLLFRCCAFCERPKASQLGGTVKVLLWPQELAELVKPPARHKLCFAQHGQLLLLPRAGCTWCPASLSSLRPGLGPSSFGWCRSGSGLSQQLCCWKRATTGLRRSHPHGATLVAAPWGSGNGSARLSKGSLPRCFGLALLLLLQIAPRLQALSLPFFLS